MGEIKRTEVLVITGPTATGKSEVAIRLGQQTGAEIISADSMQVYKYMDIGTAKVPPDQRSGIPHHLIDVVYPDEFFSVSDFQRMALEKIREINRRGNLPVVVGGTGLYIRALREGYVFHEMNVNWDLRNRLKQEASRRGPEALHDRLSKVDPESASRIHPNDVRRVIRALEVFEETGIPLSRLREERLDLRGVDFKVVGLWADREYIYSRTDLRVDSMMKLGLVEEVRHLLEMGYGEGLFSMKSLGYYEMTQYLKGRATLQEAIRLLKRNTRWFVKRQMTWFGHESEISWIHVDKVTPKEVLSEISGICEGIRGRL